MRKGLTMTSLALLLGVLACGDDEATQPEPPASYRNLIVHLQAMTPHVGQLMELRVTSSDNQMQGLLIVDPLPSAELDLLMKSSVPEGDHRLDFFADLNMNSSYDPPPADHAWRLDLPSMGDAEVTFSHNTNFTDIDEPPFSDLGSQFRLDITGFDPHVGQLFETRVIHLESGRTVGQYRLEMVPNHDFDIEIRDIIETGAEYQIDFYADLNGNGSYDAPPTDHAWRIIATGTVDGLNVTFAHNANFTDIDF